MIGEDGIEARAVVEAQSNIAITREAAGGRNGRLMAPMQRNGGCSLESEYRQILEVESTDAYIALFG